MGGGGGAKAQGPGRGVETRRGNNKQQAEVCFPIFSPGIEQAHSESTAKSMNRKNSEKPCLSGRGLRKRVPGVLKSMREIPCFVVILLFFPSSGPCLKGCSNYRIYKKLTSF